MASAASLTADLSLNTTAFAAAFGRVRGIISGAASRIAAIGTAGLAAGAAAFAGLAAGALGVKSALDVGGQLADLSAQTGLAAGELQVLQQAFKNNGLAAEDVGGTLNKLQKEIAEGSDAFARMGVNLDAIRAMNASDQLKTVGAAINGISDPAQRTAAAMEVFGKSGAKMLTLFSDSSAMDLAASEIGTQAEIMSRNAGLFDDISDKLSLTGTKVQGFFVGVADKVAPVIGPLLDKFVSLDLAKYGQAIGEGIAFIIQAVADGSFTTILFNSARIAFARAVNFLVAALTAIGSALGQIVIEEIATAIELFSILTTADFWKGVMSSWLGIAQAFTALILDGVAALLEKLKDVPLIGEKIGDGAQNLRDSAAAIRAQGATNRGEGADLLGPALERARGRLDDALGGIFDAMKEGFKNGSDLIDTSGWEAQMGQAIDGVFSQLKTNEDAAKGKTPDSNKAPGTFNDEGRRTAAFADSDRRVGLGGRAFAGKADPAVKAAQDNKKALEDNTEASRDLQKAIENRGERSTRGMGGTATFA